MANNDEKAEIFKTLFEISSLIINNKKPFSNFIKKYNQESKIQKQSGITDIILKGNDAREILDVLHLVSIKLVPVLGKKFFQDVANS